MKKRSFLLVSLMLFTMLQQALAMQNLVKTPTGSNIPIEIKPTDIIGNGGGQKIKMRIHKVKLPKQATTLPILF